MSYSKSTVDIPSLKTGLLTGLPYVIPYSAHVTGTTYVPVFKMNVNFNDLNKFWLVTTLKTDGNNAYIEVLKDSTQIAVYENKVDGTSWAVELDCSALSGLGDFIIQLKNSNAANDTWFIDLSLIHWEA